MTPSRILSSGLCLTVLACSVTDSRTLDEDLVEVVVFPQQVDLTVSDTQRFVAYGLTEAGDSVVAPVNWSASAGQITADGTYTPADTAGDYFVIAIHALRHSLGDTATVNVTDDPGVDRVVTAVDVTPSSVTLSRGATRQFDARARDQFGGVMSGTFSWSATGGSITSGGLYETGSATGTFAVVAQEASGVADTADVTIVDPVVSSVEVTPASVSLRPADTWQFEAVARDQFGDAMQGTFSWSATGGSITSGGLYEAGSATGTFAVVAQEASGVADTAVVTIGEPVVTTVEVIPASVSLRPGDTRQFEAVARDQLGAVMQGTFNWTATGGSVTSDGSYAAGSAVGSYEVVATEASGLADTAAVSISEQAAFPNEPAGLSLLGEHSFPSGYFESFSSTATYTASGARWVIRDYEKRLHIETDMASAPVSPPGTMGMAYPTGMPSSGEPASFELHVPEQRELYVSYHFFMASNPSNGMWEMEPAGVKILGYISYGSDVQQNQGPLGFKPGGLQPGPFNISSDEYRGKPSSCANYVDEANRSKITLDEWHQLEIYVKLNDMGVGNGIHRMWVDGQLYTDCTQMSFITSSEPHGFWQVHFQPVWGGFHAGLVKSQDDFAYLDHIYVSGVNK
jgi:hypothetical protein